MSVVPEPGVPEPSPVVQQVLPYPVRLEVDYPERMSRLTTFFRAFLVIPHIAVLFFVGIAQGVVGFFAWWMILFTGKFPKGMFDFVAKIFRWQTRVNAYSMFLTGKYPPFGGDA
ncbi:MAG: DUF4389 domain-containing protein [Chloroflexi bacterium]|nr:DUF4389 domain-containing protein [Chloroflexota bacterium]